jgi:nitric oxide reductase NorE protein
VEYADKAAHGIGIETDTFFTLFYLMTGFHALHVIMGLVVLVIVGWKNSVDNLETGAAFWHMVDLIWLILFPIVYLVR